MIASLIRHYPVRMAVAILAKVAAATALVFIAGPVGALLWVNGVHMATAGIVGTILVVLVLSFFPNNWFWRVLTGWPPRPTGTDLVR